jgi:ribosomal protein S27AE
VSIVAGVPAQPGGHQASVVAVLSVLLLLGVLTVAPLTYALLLRRGMRRALRLCPRCGATGVRAAASQVDGVRAEVRLQCGQCDAWREVVVPQEALLRYDRQVERDRRDIDTQAERLECDDARADVEAFTEVLRSEIAGPDDFLALTRAARPQSAEPPR